MSRRFIAMGAFLAVCLVLGATLVVPVDVRHSAPFGFRLTLDPDRAIAVTGATVTPNYPNFHRVDLDLRSYTPDERYDLTVYVQEVPLPATGEEGEGDAAPEPVPAPAPGPSRTVRLGLDHEDIAAEKGAFADPFVSVRFDPIEESSGRAYYVWVDSGASNDDAVLTVWSVKSYSRVAGYTVLAAFLADPPGDVPGWVGRIIFGTAIAGFALASAAVAAALAGARGGTVVPVGTGRSGRESRAGPGPGWPE